MLIAAKPFRYATRQLLPGEPFDPRTPGDGRVLMALGKARYATKDMLDLARPRQGSNDIAALRQAYTEKLGKKPFNGWNAATLRSKMAEADKG